ncbi:hypothetical protein BDV96DRAFT_311848 [Lophiotrema nucula]|uniref:Uncharacterized protein n=1 Tax=Lophiotrema nucula TaxID=690887 RepID=A0A6A5YJ17_9PLEO|nr:hypothetical protein BDV96DRAFT_311848 [Lophiotrema nucula]
MLSSTIFSIILLPLALAAPRPDAAPSQLAHLADRQVTRTTLFGTCHTATPTNNIPRGQCTVTSPLPEATEGLVLGCNTGSLNPRLTNCTTDGSQCHGTLQLFSPVIC